MFYRSQMISLKCKHLIQSVTGFLIIPKFDHTKCHQILAINRITKLNITREYLKLRKRYRKVIIRHFIKDMLLAKRLQLMITSGSFFGSMKRIITASDIIFRNIIQNVRKKERKRYRKIGQECAGIVEGVAMNVRPGQTEQEIADKIRTGCIANGISPDCVLVGSDERILNYRHPVPTSKKIEKSLMVVLGGEKYGRVL